MADFQQVFEWHIYPFASAPPSSSAPQLFSALVVAERAIIYFFPHFHSKSQFCFRVSSLTFENIYHLEYFLQDCTRAREMSSRDSDFLLRRDLKVDGRKLRCKIDIIKSVWEENNITLNWRTLDETRKLFPHSKNFSRTAPGWIVIDGKHCYDKDLSIQVIRNRFSDQTADYAS